MASPTRGSFATHPPFLALLFVSAASWGACDCGTEQNPCETLADCGAGAVCIDGFCRTPSDGDIDAAVCERPLRCGELCCDPGQTCGSDRSCCQPGDLCGGECCGGAFDKCVADTCVLDCGDTAACGDVCCDGEDVCLLNLCTAPGAPCSGTFECPEGEYCEASISRCLPRVTEGPECQYEPEAGDFELAVEWHWGGDSEVLPEWDQVMSAPMVANLTDDNGDGNIDQNDIPDVVFNSFHRSSPNRGPMEATYNTDGVLRAISGADGSRLWPRVDPPYRTQPAVEVAIADVRSDSPGPEVIACTFDPGTTGANPRVSILSAAGDILFRFVDDLALGCSRPAVADMNGDGVAEIVVGNTIAQADGSSLLAATLTGVASVTALYNVDDDPDLELIGLNGVADHDGATVWQDELFAGDSGYVAVADMDLDGDPDIVAVASGAHMVTVRDGATGMLLAGPVEITPTEDPAIAARVAAIMAAAPTRDALSGGGPPTIANFDEDPEPEIALAGGYAYVVFDSDLSRKWYFETQDTSSRATGSSVFDFEGDGVAEVLYNDEQFFRAFRGPTGDVYLERCNTSGTLLEYPIVVDVDNDDHAEVIVVENNYSRSSCADGTPSQTGVWAFGHPRNQWVRTRRIWNQHSYHVTNINEDGTLPVREAPNHSNPRLNNFRQNVQPDGLFDAPDLVLRDLAFSTSECNGALLLQVRVVNAGRAGAPAGVPVSFYVDGTFLARVTTTVPLLAGASEVLSVRFEEAVPGTSYSFSAELNDVDHEPLQGLNECRPDNNSAGPGVAACPTIG